MRYERPRPGETVALRDPSLWYHRIGTPQDRDKAIHRAAPGNVKLLIGDTLTPDGQYLFITEGTEAATEGLGQLRSRMLLLDLVSASSPDVLGAPTSLSSVPDYRYRLVGQSATGLLHVLTDRDAPRRRIVAIDREIRHRRAGATSSRRGRMSCTHCTLSVGGTWRTISATRRLWSVCSHPMGDSNAPSTCPVFDGLRHAPRCKRR